MWNPLYLFNELLGPRVCNAIGMALFCAAFIGIAMLIGPCVVCGGDGGVSFVEEETHKSRGQVTVSNQQKRMQWLSMMMMLMMMMLMMAMSLCQYIKNQNVFKIYLMQRPLHPPVCT